jgi:pSer/pThr/pTyr-binding forkhead associated (FHA) protein
MSDAQSYSPPRKPAARLVWQTEDGQHFKASLGTINTIGRGLDCEISIPEPRLSRQHAEIKYIEGIFTITDLGSINGTYHNNALIQTPTLLKNGDWIQTGPVKFHFQINQPADQTIEIAPPKRATLVIPEPARPPRLEIRSGPQLSLTFEIIKQTTKIGRIGRGEKWDIPLQDRAVSRPQAQITRQGNDFILTDLESVNGTLLNGEVITESHPLKDGDTITLGETLAIFWAGKM